MSTTEQLLARRADDWRSLNRLLDRSRLAAEDVSQLSTLYRAVCADLVRARQSGVSPDVVQHLDGLAARAHGRLYGRGRFRAAGLWYELYARFPRTLRQNGRFFALASALFVVPLLLTLIATLFEPGIASRVVPRGSLQGAAESYSTGFRGRDSGTDTQMFGFYIYNNVGIAFRCFATGILFGLGSAWFLVFNGLAIGAVLGFVIQAGHGRNILTFVCGHGPFELTAIVISGAAGIRMGWALLETGGLTRLSSLRRCADELVVLVLGAGAMLVIAAILEGYWSPSGLPDVIKWGAGAGFSVLVGLWLGFAGRRT